MPIPENRIVAAEELHVGPDSFRRIFSLTLIFPVRLVFSEDVLCHFQVAESYGYGPNFLAI